MKVLGSEFCDVCRKRVTMMCQRNTGVCSQQCEEARSGHPVGQDPTKGLKTPQIGPDRPTEGVPVKMDGLQHPRYVGFA